VMRENKFIDIEAETAGRGPEAVFRDFKDRISRKDQQQSKKNQNRDEQKRLSDQLQAAVFDSFE